TAPAMTFAAIQLRIRPPDDASRPPYAAQYQTRTPEIQRPTTLIRKNGTKVPTGSTPQLPNERIRGLSGATFVWTRLWDGAGGDCLTPNPARLKPDHPSPSP